MDYPNGTEGEPQQVDCGSVEDGGCFFDLTHDHTEHTNLIEEEQYKQLIEEMRQKFVDLEATKISFNRGKVEDDCCQQIAKNGGYWGPWVHCDDFETCVYDTDDGLVY